MIEPIINDISIIEGNKNELILFPKGEDVKSFQKLLEINRQSNSRTLVSLNTATNTKKFLNRFQNFDGKIFLCFEGTRTGDALTLKILLEYKEKNIKDIRNVYAISQNGNKDLTAYLEKKLQQQNINSNLVETKLSEDAETRTKSSGLSETKHLESGTSGQNLVGIGDEDQSQHNRNYGVRQNMGSDNAGNGFGDTERDDFRAGESTRRAIDTAESQNDEQKIFRGANHIRENCAQCRKIQKRIFRNK
ncbi:hypothetical protein [Chryseobacterium bernardetii]|uniref:hypothetical protein n=1 Tax=Chryseobacterium bernardetii TaxID=1241978 RepID=UPI000F500996|nr:hypothetical protein [Chryseobacterium bernardetii]AZB32246.1 hypothetical protein EG351_00410 [Chryseobacterium bernardetii]